MCCSLELDPRNNRWTYQTEQTASFAVGFPTDPSSSVAGCIVDPHSFPRDPQRSTSLSAKTPSIPFNVIFLYCQLERGDEFPHSTNRTSWFRKRYHTKLLIVLPQYEDFKRGWNSLCDRSKLRIVCLCVLVYFWAPIAAYLDLVNQKIWSTNKMWDTSKLDFDYKSLPDIPIPEPIIGAQSCPTARVRGPPGTRLVGALRCFRADWIYRDMRQRCKFSIIVVFGNDKHKGFKDWLLF